MELVHDSPGHPDPVIEYEAYKTLADAHRASAAALSPSSEGRALMLRCAGRWDRIALNTAIRNDLRVDHRALEVVS